MFLFRARLFLFFVRFVSIPALHDNTGGLPGAEFKAGRRGRAKLEPSHTGASAEVVVDDRSDRHDLIRQCKRLPRLRRLIPFGLAIKQTERAS